MVSTAQVTQVAMSLPTCLWNLREGSVSVGRRGTGQRDRPCRRAWWMLRRVYEPAILQKSVCVFGRLFRRHSFHIEVKLVKMDTSDIERLTNIE